MPEPADLPPPSLTGNDPEAPDFENMAEVVPAPEGRMPDVPNIAGESAMYLTKQLQDFRSGERRHEQMSIIAGALGDDDIADLAAYYASIEFTVKVPEF